MRGWTFLAVVMPLLVLSSGTVVWALLRSVLVSFAGGDARVTTGVLVPAFFVWLVLLVAGMTAHIWTTRVPRGSVLPGAASLMVPPVRA